MAEESPQVAPDHWHLRDAHELARQHGVDPAHGLLADEASRRAQQHGPNEIQGRPGRSLWGQFLDQFKDFMVLVLLGAAVISGVIGDLIDTLAILVIVLLNAAIGFVQAWRADKAMAALQQLAATHATVLRGGQAKARVVAAQYPDALIIGSDHHSASLSLHNRTIPGTTVTTSRWRNKHSAMCGEQYPFDKMQTLA